MAGDDAVIVGDELQRSRMAAPDRRDVAGAGSAPRNPVPLVPASHIVLLRVQQSAPPHKRQRVRSIWSCSQFPQCSPEQRRAVPARRRLRGRRESKGCRKFIMNAAESLFRSLCLTIVKFGGAGHETPERRGFLRLARGAATWDRRHDVIARPARAGRNATNRNRLPYIVRRALHRCNNSARGRGGAVTARSARWRAAPARRWARGGRS